MEETIEKGPESPSEEPKPSGIKGFFSKHGSTIVLIVLIAYVILLGIGVTAEVFKIQSILDWWIFNPPKR